MSKAKRMSVFNKTIWAIALMCIPLSFTCCNEDDENYLDGSVTDGYNMNFDFVRVRLYPETSISIEYVKNSDTGEKMPLRLTIDHPEIALSSGAEYNLVTEGSISRGVGFDKSPLPTLESGSIRLHTFSGTASSSVNGDFEAVFTGTNGAKINLHGAYSSSLERVE